MILVSKAVVLLEIISFRSFSLVFSNVFSNFLMFIKGWNSIFLAEFSMFASKFQK